MSHHSDQRSSGFLGIAGQFKLGALVTESSHPVTANLSAVAKQDIAAALDLLFQVDDDVLKKFREFVDSGRVEVIAATVLGALRNGGRIFFTGCGATGRLSILLDSVWRDFWQRRSAKPAVTCSTSSLPDLENRTFSVMAGGDYALIKSVEGFEDFTAFGKKQIADLGVCEKDVVFAITEGGETSFVIGTAWQGVDVGAKVFFVYNNPDDVLCKTVERSREFIEEPRIEKLNLTTGPMAITGSTRMQATTIQLCVMITVLEVVARRLLDEDVRQASSLPDSGRLETCHAICMRFFAGLQQMHATLKSPEVLSQLAKLVTLEESIYRVGGKNNYFADSFGIDVLTDTTERSPTFCTPPFRKFDDAAASESWSFLFLPDSVTRQAWRRILRREPRCVDWRAEDVREMVSSDKLPRTVEILGSITENELMRFRIGLDGLTFRRAAAGDGGIAVISENEKELLLSADGIYRMQLEAARKGGMRTGLVYFGSEKSVREIAAFTARWNSECVSVFVPTPDSDLLLAGVTRAGVKMLLNALSTSIMVRLGRVMGNYMVWVVPSNLKLIDRATRYITRLTELDYEAANKLLFEIIEYIEPRMEKAQAYPPVVGMAVLRVKEGLSNEEAEQRLMPR